MLLMNPHEETVFSFDEEGVFIFEDNEDNYEINARILKTKQHRQSFS
jgi:hypothetical protein